MAKKQKYIPLTGITGEGDDYHVYQMSPVETVTGFAIGAAAAAIAAHIMFATPVVDLIIGVMVGFYFISVYKEHLRMKRQKLILTQFRDLLDSLSNSFSAGKNTPDAFSDAYNDLLLTYNKQTPLVKELSIVLSGLYNNYVIEDLLKDMAKRCDVDDMNSFAETFAVCNRLGGNMKKVVSESRDIINDKIEVEMEIQTTVTAGKNEINIMSVLPFLVVAMMGTLGNSAITANTPLNVIVKIIACVLFYTAYKAGRKITNIKV